MPTTLRGLMADARISMRRATSFDDGVLDVPIESAHSSDLSDPTPWLTRGCLLLTDGMQFTDRARPYFDEYVARLREHGVLALGFASRIIHDEIPDELARACAEQGLPLLEISERTPFMAVIRAVTDGIAADERERLERSLRAQRSVARAALRPDGLAAILRELERELGCWVALFNAAGERVHVPTERPVPDALTDAVDTAVADVLARGGTAALRLSVSGERDVTLQTLGLRGSLRGVLAVGIGTGTADRASADLIEAVIALASIALEQSSTLEDARRRLRSGVLELLLSGAHDVAGRTIEHLWGPLPLSGFTVGCVRTPPTAPSSTVDTLSAALALWGEKHRGAFFFADHGADIVVVTRRDATADVVDLLTRHRAHVGLADVESWAGFASGLSEARRALSRTTATRPVTDFAELASTGLLGHLEQTHAHEVARRMLAPIADEPALRAAGSVWLEHNCSWDRAATQLGVHRHTLRSRIDTIGRRLGMNLDGFAARAELWAALQLTQTEDDAQSKTPREG